MRSLGYPVFRYKLASSSSPAPSLASRATSRRPQFGYVNPELLAGAISGDAMMMVILGGMGTLFGPCSAPSPWCCFRKVFADLTKHWLLLMGAFVVLAVLVLPRGIGGWLSLSTAK